MKLKPFIAAGSLISVFLALTFFTTPVSNGMYGQKLDQSGLFKNTAATALPQTVVADMVENHFHSSLPAGKTVKKCIVIGLDGARCDSALNFKGVEGSAIDLLSSSGGLYIATAGGDGKLIHSQPTKTVPGWTTVLTGSWANVHHAWYNGILKLTNPKTFLTTLVHDGSAKSAAFKCIWPWHVQKAYSTYRLESLYTKALKIPVKWDTYPGQDELQTAILAEAADPKGADIIFSIYERPDEAGHGYGFSNDVPEYAESVRLCDKDAYDIMQTIEARESYATEDWLIIMTSDHGGQDKDHGNLSEDCRFIFIAANKAITINE